MRRSPLRRTQPEAKTSVPIIRKRICKKWFGGCGHYFRPLRPMQKACSHECALGMLAVKKIKDEAQAKQASKKAARAERKKDQAKRESLKTISDLIKEAQGAFNKYCRLRDAGRGCISCGTPIGAGSIGGDSDAGHYRSRGAAPHLRFNEDNCHAQCKRCNRYGAGNVAAYRIGLLERIGPERLAALEADNEPVKWSRDMLTTIKAVYRAKARELEKQ